MSSFGQNSIYFQSVNNIHYCLLSLSGAEAEVEKVQIKPTGTVVKVSKPGTLESLAGVDLSEQDGINYKTLALNGCLVVWEAA